MKSTSTACKHRVSGSLSLPSRGAFHLSLTVLYAIGPYWYFALEGGPPCFPQGSSCLVVLWIPPCQLKFRLRDFHPLWSAFPKLFCYLSWINSAVRTPGCSHPGLGSSGFARRYFRNHGCFLFLRLLRCFSSPGSLCMAMDSPYSG